MRPPPPLGLRSTFPPNKTPPPWEILATGLRRGMNAYMCGGNHGRQSHATSRIRLTHVHRTVLDGHVLGALDPPLHSLPFDVRQEKLLVRAFSLQWRGKLVAVEKVRGRLAITAKPTRIYFTSLMLVKHGKMGTST